MSVSWILAQSIKVTRNVLKNRRFNFRWIVDTGGMPSSHSAGTAALATVIGIYAGVDSIIFLFALIFALVTMFDAASVRRSVGRQAIILNKMIDEFSVQGRVEENRLREFLGHTPVEVFVGAVLGITVSYVICIW
nr:conserved hypothetical protein, acid phosphatase/vanadium-dependent haloperoxidase related [uncultured bacterium]